MDVLHADDHDGLEVQEEQHGVSGDVGGGSGVTESGQGSGQQQADTSDHCAHPLDCGLRHCFTVAEEHLHTGQVLVFGAVYPHLSESIDVRDVVRNAWDFVDVLL